MLMSYSDADYVPDEYDRELNRAREMAVEIEHITDDPPDRIAAWISTVNDQDLRALDQQMLVDLLRLEDRPEAWASVLELALARLEQLVLVSDLRLAGEMPPRSPAWPATRTRHSRRTRARGSRATTGPLVGHLMLSMRQIPDEAVPPLHTALPGPGAGPHRAAGGGDRQRRQPPGRSSGEGRADRLRHGGPGAGQDAA